MHRFVRSSRAGMQAVHRTGKGGRTREGTGQAPAPADHQPCGSFATTHRLCSRTHLPTSKSNRQRCIHRHGVRPVRLEQQAEVSGTALTARISQPEGDHSVRHLRQQPCADTTLEVAPRVPTHRRLRATQTRSDTPSLHLALRARGRNAGESVVRVPSSWPGERESH